MAGEIDPKAAGELAENVKMAGKYAEEALDSFQKQLKVITQMRDAMEEVSKIMSGLSQQDNKALNPDAWKKVTKEVLKNEKASRDASKAFKEVSGSGSKLIKGLSLVGGALTGLAQGFKNVVALGRGVLGFFFSVADGIFEVGKSILAIPFKMMAGLFKMASTGGSNELLEALENVRDAFGDLKSESSRAIVDTAKNIEKMNESGVPSYLIFGNLAGRIKAVTEMAQGMGAAFQVFQGEVEENGTAMMLYQRGLGITNEQMSTIASNAMRMGTSIAKVQNEMTKQALGMSKAFGVNAKVISKDMAKAMSDLAHFGHLSTKEMAVAATFANKLGVSVDKLTAIMDQTATYDQAAEGMSKLNEQYGTNLDATEIMMAQNPAEKVELLRKAFAATGKDMSKLTYQDRMFIKQQTGMSDELMNSAFAAKNAGVSLDRMKTEAEKAEKATMSQTEAIKALGDSIKRTFPSGSGGHGGIMDHFLDGFFRGIQTSKEFIGMMMNIRQVLRIATQEGVKFGREFVNLFPGVKEIFTGIKEVFDPARFRKMFDGVFKALDVFRVSGSGKIEDFVERIKAVFADFTSGGAGEKVKEGFKKFGKAVLGILIATGEWAFNALKDTYKKIVHEFEDPGPTTRAVMQHMTKAISDLSVWITSAAVPFVVNAVESFTNWLKPNELRRNLPPASKVVSTVMEAFKPLGRALMDAGEKLSGPLARLGAVIVDKLWQAVQSVWDAMPWEQKLTILFVKFGPALVNGFVAIGGTAGLKTAAAWVSSFVAGIGAAPAVLAAAVAAALAGIVFGTQWLKDSYAKAREESQKETESFYEDLGKDIDPKSRMQKLQKEMEDASKQAGKTGSWFDRTVDSIFGSGDEHAGHVRRFEAAQQNLWSELRAEAGRSNERVQKLIAENTQGTKEWIAKNSEKALKELGPVTIENATERFKKIEEMSKKVMSKDFDIQGKLDAIRAKLSGINWFIMDEPQQLQMNTALARLQTVQQIMANIADIGGTTKVAADKLAALGNAFSPDSAAMKAVSKDGNLSKAINATKDMFAGENKIDVSAIQTASIGLENARKMFQDAAGLSSSMTEFSNSISSSEGVARQGIARTLKAVEDMVAATKKMDAALASIDKIDIGARLTQVAGAMGLGGSASKTYTVQSKEVVLNVTFNVTMDAQELEKVMIGNKKSVIRDRINFALDRGAKSDTNTKNALLKSTPASITGYYGSDIPGSL